MSPTDLYLVDACPETWVDWTNIDEGETDAVLGTGQLPNHDVEKTASIPPEIIGIDTDQLDYLGAGLEGPRRSEPKHREIGCKIMLNPGGVPAGDKKTLEIEPLLAESNDVEVPSHLVKILKYVGTGYDTQSDHLVDRRH